jgi:predicted acylesterase/phospholipase RssA
MKGGITSGIVYPAAAIALAERYRFRSIGGTSAGAIAAALVAAAEYARESGGFERLRGISDQFSQEGFLPGLFEPSDETRPLMETLTRASELWREEKKRSAGQPPEATRARLQRLAATSATLLKQTHGSAYATGVRAGHGLVVRGGRWVAAIAAGIAFVSQLLLSAVSGGFARGPSILLPIVLWTVVCAVLAGGIFYAWADGYGKMFFGLGHALAGLFDLLIRKVPENAYGMTKGHRREETSGHPLALTDWLNAAINELAGRGPDAPPLTFGELASKRLAAQDVGITVNMVSTDLSHGQPYKLPFGTRRWIFKREEMETFFPASVVDHLYDRRHQPAHVDLPEGYFFLPDASDLPLVLAARMSLSFPILISAVPLYTIAVSALERERTEPKQILAEDLQTNWFSDGGISSNFPIHFFDRWFPNRPTFGINLTSWPEDAFVPHQDRLRKTHFSQAPGDAGVSERVGKAEAIAAEPQTGAIVLPTADRPYPPEWQKIDTLAGFLGGIWNTAQNYRDNTQSRLPSYRERIVQVRLRAGEGGLNLSMTAGRINALKERGALAGETLRDDFFFPHHQWVRLLVLLSLLEGQARHAHADRIDLAAIIEEQQTATELKFPYARDPLWCTEALTRLTVLQELIDRWQTEPFFEQGSPRPAPVLRVTPDL